jgi:hypothetical protein
MDFLLPTESFCDLEKAELQDKVYLKKDIMGPEVTSVTQISPILSKSSEHCVLWFCLFIKRKPIKM